MPKLIAPHGASWRGRVLAAGERFDVSDAEAFELFAHGFRLAEAPVDARDAETDPTAPSRKELLKLLRGQGAGNLFVKSTEELRALAVKVLAERAAGEVPDGRE